MIGVAHWQYGGDEVAWRAELRAVPANTNKRGGNFHE